MKAALPLRVPYLYLSAPGEPLVYLTCAPETSPVYFPHGYMGWLLLLESYYTNLDCGFFSCRFSFWSKADASLMSNIHLELSFFDVQHPFVLRHYGFSILC